MRAGRVISGGGAMRVAFWNILHGGGTRRIPEIALALLEWSADLIVLCEYRRTMGGQLRGVLGDHGWEHQACTEPAEGKNGVLVASRRGMERLAEVAPGSQRLVGVRVEGGVEVLGVHVPPLEAEDGEAQVVWGQLLEAARRGATGRTLVVGDLNAGRRWQDEAGVSGNRRLSRDPPGVRRVGSEAMGRLWLMGYRDVWRESSEDGGVEGASGGEAGTRGETPGNRREFTWFSHEGRGVRIDHALASAGLFPRVRGAWYEHGVRERGVSDHAAIVVDISETP